MLVVLRLGHRVSRDVRVTTHIALAARALGVDEVILSGERDEGIIKSACRVSEKWGGSFRVSYEEDWRKVLRDFDGVKVHLTMYGLPVNKVIKKIRKAKKVLVAVGAGKVPREVYELVDYNVAITSQPHSEVSALAIFLHEYFRGRELKKKKFGGKLKIIPKLKGKKIINKTIEVNTRKLN